LSWHVVFDSYSGASAKVRNDYSDVLKTEKSIGPLLDFIVYALGHSTGEGLNLEKTGFTPSKIREYDPWEADSQETNARSMEWSLVNLYYFSLKYVPSLVKNWWLQCKSRQTTLAVEKWTARFFSSLVLEDSLEEVRKWSTDQKLANDEKELLVKISNNTKEIQVGYEVDDMFMQLAIKFPQNYPLEGVQVESINRVAVDSKRWQGWMRTTQGVITFSVSYLHICPSCLQSNPHL
jgi:hypothetical protein